MAQYFQISFDQLKQLFPDLPATVGEENVQYTIVNHGQEVQLNNIQLGNLQVQEDVRQGSISNNCISVVKAENLNGQFSLALKDDNPDRNNIYVLESLNTSSNSPSVHVQSSESIQANHHQAISTDSLASNHLQAIYITTSPSQQVVPPVTYISVQSEDVNELSETSQTVSDSSTKDNDPTLATEEEVQVSTITKSLTVNKENQASSEGKELEESEEIIHGSALSTAQVQAIQQQLNLKHPTVQTETIRPSTQLIGLSVPPQAVAPHVSPVRHIHSNSQLSTTQVSLPNGRQISLQEYRRMNSQTNSIQTYKGWGRGGSVVRQMRGRRGTRRGSAHSPMRLASPASSLTPGRVIVLDQRRDGEPVQFLVRNDSLQGNTDQEHQPAQLAGQQGSNTGVNVAQFVQSDEQRQVVMLLPGGSMGEHQMLTVTMPANEIDSNVPVVSAPERTPRQVARYTPKNKFVSPTSGTVVLNPGHKRSIGLEGVVEQTCSGSFVGTPVLAKHNIEERKLVPGKVAHCQYCGYHSEDFNRCERCRRKVPVNCKEMPITHSKINKDGIPSQKFYKGIREGVMADNMQKPERSPRVRKPRKQFEEPVILTISSDEDEDAEGKNDASAREAPANSFETENGTLMSLSSVMEPMLPPLSSLSAFEKEPVIKDIELDDPASDGEQNVAEEIAAGVQEMHNGVVEEANGSRPVYLTCRTVRIGSYKAVPRERVIICKQGVRICVPDIEDGNKSVTITFRLKNIVKALIHFGRAMPVIFLYTTYSSGLKIRSTLKMNSKRGPYYDPCSAEETQKRITLLPERMTEDTRSRLKSLFGAKDLLIELDNKEANDILVRASPKEVQETIKKTVAASPSMIGLRPSKDYFQKILIYPPPPAKGGITINPEDYCCLGEDQFLNDVIIDFYLKYLTQSCLSEKDQLRTHVFSSFFYKRLTTRPVRSARRHHPMELDSSTSPAEKRHARVKSWTKNVDIFEKDFIVIPINESAHWFLAIICFPGLEGCVRMSDGVPVKLPPSQPKPTKKPKEMQHSELENQEMPPQPCLVKPIQIGATTITPIIASSVEGTGGNIVIPAAVNVEEREASTVVDEFSDRDEAEGEEEDIQMPSESEDEVQQEGKNEGEREEEKEDKEEEDNEETQVKMERDTHEETKEDEKGDGSDEIHLSIKTEAQPDIKPDPDQLSEEGPKKPNIEYCSPNDPIKQPCILIFDSLAGSSRSRVVATLRDYLRIEYKVKKGKDREFSKDTIRGACPRVPQQTNFVDCGVYVLQYVESFFENPIKDYRIPIRSLTQWFPEEVAHRKREAIHELILQLMKEQNITLRLPKITLPSAASRANQPNPQDEREECLKSVGEMEMCKKLGEQTQIIIKTDQTGQRVVTGGIRVISMCKLSDGMKLVLETPNDGAREQVLPDPLQYEDMEERVGGLYDAECRSDMVERMEVEEGEEEEAFEEEMEALEEGELEEGKKDPEDWEDDEEEEMQRKRKSDIMKAYSALVSPCITKRKLLRQDVVIDPVKSENEASCDSESPNKRPKC